MTTHASTTVDHEEGQRGIDIHTREDSEVVVLVFSMGSSRYVLPIDWEEVDAFAKRLTEVAEFVGAQRKARLRTYD